MWILGAIEIVRNERKVLKNNKEGRVIEISRITVSFLISIKLIKCPWKVSNWSGNILLNVLYT